MFQHPAFIVLDVPSPMREAIAQLRKQADPAFPPLPVEITLTGSSGVGPIESAESPERVFALLDEFAARMTPADASFAAIERFPNSPVVYLSLNDPASVVALHKAIIALPISFRATPYPFVPHCTIRSHGAGALDEVEFARIVVLPISRDDFRLETMSVYELDSIQRECRLLHRTRLAG